MSVWFVGRIGVIISAILAVASLSQACAQSLNSSRTPALNSSRTPALNSSRTPALNSSRTPALNSSPTPAFSSSVTPEVARYINGVVNESVNANTLFASHSAVSTGQFSQRRTVDPDKGYRTFRIPGEVLLGATTDAVRPFVNGNAALLHATSGLAPIDGVGDDDFAVTRLYAASGGVGAYIKVSESLAVAPMASLTYSHITNSYDFNNPYSQTVLAQADDELFNWDIDLFTYAPALKVIYERDLSFALLEYELAYTHLFNDSIRTRTPAINILSSTGLMTSRVAMLTPLGVRVDKAPLSVRPFFQWSNISGSAVKGLGLRDLFEVGAELVTHVVEYGAWVSNVTLGASYVSGRDFEGYHLGLGVEF